MRLSGHSVALLGDSLSVHSDFGANHRPTPPLHASGESDYVIDLFFSFVVDGSNSAAYRSLATERTEQPNSFSFLSYLSYGFALPMKRGYRHVVRTVCWLASQARNRSKPNPYPP